MRMAPPRIFRQKKQNDSNLPPRKRMITRSQNLVQRTTVPNGPVIIYNESRAKRKAEASPPKEKKSKRSALADLSNAKVLGVHKTQGPKMAVKEVTVAQMKPSSSQAKFSSQTSSNRTLQKPVINAEVVPQKPKPVPRVKAVNKNDENVEIASKLVHVRRSLDLEKSEDSSLYVSALEDISNISRKSRKSNTQPEQIEDHVKECERLGKDDVILIEVQLPAAEPKQVQSLAAEPKQVQPLAAEPKQVQPLAAEPIKPELALKPISGKSVLTNLDAPPKIILPEGVEWDFDAENWLDPLQVPHYAMDIFNYLKDRERLFPIEDYIDKQPCLSRWMRALLVDWMVEVQESFELNHETLYLAVKLVDLYLTKVTVGKETLQLLGSACLFVASKYDERVPPMIEDFLYICDGAYSQRELIRMEINILKVVNFDIGIPLSYRFLRRYARCAKLSMPTLTLARYILEYSLMNYATITFSDSKMAAAALLIALKMKDIGGWTPTLEYYSGYTVDDIREIAEIMNEGLHRKHNRDSLHTVRNKYSHRIFFEVAKLPLIDSINV